MMPRTGPVDPALARDLAAAAARSPAPPVPLRHRPGPPARRPRLRPPPAARIIAVPPPATGPVTLPAMTTYRPGPVPSGWTSPPSPANRARQPGPAPARRRRRGAWSSRWRTWPGRVITTPGDGARPGNPAAAPDRDLECLLYVPGLSSPGGSVDDEHSTPYEKGGRNCLCEARASAGATTGTSRPPAGTSKTPAPRLVPLDHPSGRSYLSRPTQYPD